MTYDEFYETVKDDTSLVKNDNFKSLILSTVYFGIEVKVSYMFREDYFKSTNLDGLILDSVNISFTDKDGEYDYETHYSDFLSVRKELVKLFGSNQLTENETVISSTWTYDSHDVYHRIEKTAETQWAIHALEFTRLD